MGLFGWKGKELKMVWRVEKEGKTSFLVGTSHFFRHSFRRALTRLIQGAENVLFEGPLDDESMARVAAYGRQAEGSPSLLEALDPKVIREINRQMNNWGSPIKRHLSREKSIPTVRGVSSSSSVVRIGVDETNQ